MLFRMKIVIVPCVDDVYRFISMANDQLRWQTLLDPAQVKRSGGQSTLFVMLLAPVPGNQSVTPRLTARDRPGSAGVPKRLQPRVKFNVGDEAATRV